MSSKVNRLHVTLNVSLVLVGLPTSLADKQSSYVVLLDVILQHS